MRRSHHRFLSGLVVALMVSLTARFAAAQCAITGPNQICNTPISLCGPTDGSMYQWTLPDGSGAWDPCISATMPGEYSLLYLNGITGLWLGPCSMIVNTTGTTPAPAITGPTTGCNGSSISLCGPSGSFDYSWSGPGWFTGTTACVDVWNTGDYQLRVRPLPDGCWSDAAAFSVTFGTCDTTPPPPPPPPPSPPPPPPPPPTPHVQNCPRPAWWWTYQCPNGDHRPRISAAAVDSVGVCVQSNAVFMAGHDASFCSLMLLGERKLSSRARRQAAAVWANVCAGQQGLTARNGQAVALDPTSGVSLPSYTGTIASWLSFAASEFARLDPLSERDRAVRESYRKLIRTAWSINHGLGIGPTCFTHPPELSASTSAFAATGESDAMLAAGIEPEPLSAEMLNDLDGPLTLGTFEPNPFSSSSKLAFAISSTTNQDVTIGVYDISGRLVKELLRGNLAPGQYEVSWDGTQAGGASVRSGLYFVVGRIGGTQAQTRVTFVH